MDVKIFTYFMTVLLALSAQNYEFVNCWLIATFFVLFGLMADDSNSEQGL